MAGYKSAPSCSGSLPPEWEWESFQLCCSIPPRSPGLCITASLVFAFFILNSVLLYSLICHALTGTHHVGWNRYHSLLSLQLVPNKPQARCWATSMCTLCATNRLLSSKVYGIIKCVRVNYKNKASQFPYVKAAGSALSIPQTHAIFSHELCIMSGNSWPRSFPSHV